MGRYKRLLVAVDGSEPSLHALEQAFGLTDQQIIVASVVPPYTGDLRFVGVKNIGALLRAPCDQALAATREIAKARQVSIKIVCDAGEPHEKLVEIAQAEDCDLIVLGVRGWDEIEHLLMGSVAARVIGYSPKDVLVVPHRAAAGWGKMLLATNGSPHNRAAALKAADLARAYASELYILYVIDLPPGFYAYVPAGEDMAQAEARDSVAKAKKAADAAGLDARTFIREGEAFHEISRFAREQKITTIIMGSHGRTGLTRLLMGSTTERVIGFAPCPVLVVKGD